MIRHSKAILALTLCMAVLSAALAACSNESASSQSARTAASDASGSAKVSYDESTATKIVGKVTAVTGNQVTLAVGALNYTAGRQKGGESASSAVSSSSSSSSLITLTGETKTVLIPVGLTLSQGMGGGQRPEGGAVSWMPKGGPGGSASGAPAGQTPNGRQGGAVSGGRTRMTSGSRSGKIGTSSRTSGTTSNTKSSDFSSVTVGMVLQITEATLSDGSTGVVRVSVISGG